MFLTKHSKDTEGNELTKRREFGDGTLYLPAGAMGYNPVAGSLRLRCLFCIPRSKSIHYQEKKTTGCDRV